MIISGGANPVYGCGSCGYGVVVWIAGTISLGLSGFDNRAPAILRKWFVTTCLEVLCGLVRVPSHWHDPYVLTGRLRHFSMRAGLPG